MSSTKSSLQNHLVILSAAKSSPEGWPDIQHEPRVETAGESEIGFFASLRMTGKITGFEMNSK
jgi:hypothetical protein